MSFEALLETFGTIGVGDLLDIAIVATLLHFALVWFKRTKAAFVATGILILAVIYFVARQAGMYLTTWVFQGFFAIFLIALVVIFQEELRSFFERLAVRSLRRRAPNSFQPKEIEILVRTVAHFSRERIGALIVLKGRDPLERHVEGGYHLDGELSEALLESIFDSHSEGHDGAVTVEGDRVLRFGVYLPLSKEFDKLAGLGTRHTAALGLSERVDALCLVVSEERGTISVARQGNLVVVEDLKTLEEEIASFIREVIPIEPRTRWTRFIKQNTREKAVSLAFSVVLWLVFVQGFKPANQVFQVPVEVRNLRAGLELEVIHPDRVRLSLSGLKRDLNQLNPLTLRAYVNLEGARAGSHLLLISVDDLRMPEGVRLVDVEPIAVQVELAPVPGAFGGPGQ